MKPMEWIRHVHRATGLLLILFVGVKLVSGFALSGGVKGLDGATASWFHFSRWVDVPLVFLFLMHAAYGVLKIRLSRGIRRPGLALILTNTVAGLLFLLTLAFVFYK